MSHSPHPHFRVALVLAMATALGPLALDTYLPAFPAMAASLDTGVHQISLSISVYVLMLALGQLIAGPLSDRLGRASVMLTGLGIFGVASLLISRVTSLEMLILLRALQALGGGAAAVCVPALVRDRLSGNEAARFFSLIGLIMIIAPAIAPSLGSFLLSAFGWPGIFLFLALYAAFVAVLVKVQLFSGQSPRPIQHHHSSVWQRYRAVFSVRPAMRFMFLQGLAFATMLLFITHSAFIYQEHFGASPTAFALLFGANVALMIVINLSNRKLLQHFPAVRVLRWGLCLQGVGILLLILVVNLAPTLWLFLPAMMITVGAMGAITPNIQACFMDYFAEHGGTASALIGATQFSLAGAISGLSTLLPATIGWVVFAQAVCSLLCLALILSKSERELHPLRSFGE